MHEREHKEKKLWPFVSRQLTWGLNCSSFTPLLVTASGIAAGGGGGGGGGAGGGGAPLMTGGVGSGGGGGEGAM